MLLLSIALLAGVSAAFTAWLCCVALSDYFLNHRLRQAFHGGAQEERSS